MEYDITPKKLNKLLAHLPEVNLEVRAVTRRGGRRAEALLAEHRHSGAARIDVEFGSTDGFVVLNDDRGERHALSIEFGRRDRIRDDGSIEHGMEGLHVLRDAFPQARHP